MTITATTQNVWQQPIDTIDVSDPAIYQAEAWHDPFRRLRQEDPVHYCPDSIYGPYWAITRYHDIMSIEADADTFSSEIGGVQIFEHAKENQRPNFIQLDGAKHREQRAIISPAVSPKGLQGVEELIRTRTCMVLDNLPRGEEFDWVEHVSIKLTTMMLATLFDFPFEERAKLTYWSDLATTDVNAPDSPVKTEAEKVALLGEMVERFKPLFDERKRLPPKLDIISMYAHGAATSNMQGMEFMGNMLLVLVGGNDTTRNSMTGGLAALSRFPDQYRKLQENPALVESMVPEIIRYVTPVIHMRRTARRDVEFQGKSIKAGDKVVLWYVSGNRDESAIVDPDQFIIDRERPRQHTSFGFGPHRCVGNRLAELQLRVLWSEILERFPKIEVVEPPSRIYSNFINGFSKMPVIIPK